MALVYNASRHLSFVVDISCFEHLIYNFIVYGFIIVTFIDCIQLNICKQITGLIVDQPFTTEHLL